VAVTEIHVLNESNIVLCHGRAEEILRPTGVTNLFQPCPPMTDREQKHNDVLAQCIRHDASGELHRAEELINDAEREERCIRRAVWLMALLAGASLTALGYSVILLYEVAPYYTRIINHVLTVITVASIASLVVFAALWVHRRHRLIARREEVRRLAMKLLAARPVPRN
jgi:hypothetical protein